MSASVYLLPSPEASNKGMDSHLTSPDQPEGSSLMKNSALSLGAPPPKEARRRTRWARLIDSVLIRRTYLVAFDGLLILAAFYGAFALRLQEKETMAAVVANVRWLPWLALISGLPVLLFSGWYLSRIHI